MHCADPKQQATALQIQCIGVADPENQATATSTSISDRHRFCSLYISLSMFPFFLSLSLSNFLCIYIYISLSLSLSLPLLSHIFPQVFFNFLDLHLNKKHRERRTSASMMFQISGWCLNVHAPTLADILGDMGHAKDKDL